MKVILRKEDIRMPNNYVIKLLKLLNSTKEIFECNGYRIESDTNGYNYGFHVFDKTKVELFYFGILALLLFKGRFAGFLRYKNFLHQQIQGFLGA